MRGAQFRGPARRMERVGEKQKAICESGFSEFGFGGAEHGRLPSAVGVAAEKDAAWCVPAHGGDGRAEALLIAFGTAARRRSVRTRLAKGKIAAEHSESGGAEGIGERDEKESVAV